MYVLQALVFLLFAKSQGWLEGAADGGRGWEMDSIAEGSGQGLNFLSVFFR